MAALRPVRKSRISQPRCLASARSAESGFTATAWPTSVSIGRSLIESEYALHLSRSSPSRAASAAHRGGLWPGRAGRRPRAGRCRCRRRTPRPCRARRSGRGVGDDLRQLQWGGGHQPDPLARIQVLREGVGAGPDLVGHLLVVDLLAEGHDLGDLLARRRRRATTSRVRVRMIVEVLTYPQLDLAAREPTRSRQEKKSRAAIPWAKWKIDAPTIMVLSTSKNAAAVRIRRHVESVIDLSVYGRCGVTRQGYRSMRSSRRPRHQIFTS